MYRPSLINQEVNSEHRRACTRPARRPGSDRNRLRASLPSRRHLASSMLWLRPLRFRFSRPCAGKMALGNRDIRLASRRGLLTANATLTGAKLE